MGVVLFGLLCCLTVILFIIGCFDDEVIVFAIVIFVATVICGIVVKEEDKNNNTTDNVPAINRTEDEDRIIEKEYNLIKTIKDKNGNFYIIKNDELIEIDEKLYTELQNNNEVE